MGLLRMFFIALDPIRTGLSPFIKVDANDLEMAGPTEKVLSLAATKLPYRTTWLKMFAAVYMMCKGIASSV